VNPDNITHRTNEALMAVHEMASEAGHVQLTPLHMAAALAADKGGILRQGITGVSGHDEAARDSFEHVLANGLKKLSSQSPPPNSVPASTALIKVIRRVQSAQSAGRLRERAHGPSDSDRHTGASTPRRAPLASRRPC